MRPMYDGQGTWSMVGHRCCRLLLSEANSKAGCAVEGAAVRPTMGSMAVLFQTQDSMELSNTYHWELKQCILPQQQ